MAFSKKKVEHLDPCCMMNVYLFSEKNAEHLDPAHIMNVYWKATDKSNFTSFPRINDAEKKLGNADFWEISEKKMKFPVSPKSPRTFKGAFDKIHPCMMAIADESNSKPCFLPISSGRTDGHKDRKNAEHLDSSLMMNIYWISKKKEEHFDSSLQMNVYLRETRAPDFLLVNKNMRECSGNNTQEMDSRFRQSNSRRCTDIIGNCASSPISKSEAAYTKSNKLHIALTGTEPHNEYKLNYQSNKIVKQKKDKTIASDLTLWGRFEDVWERFEKNAEHLDSSLFLIAPWRDVPWAGTDTSSDNPLLSSRTKEAQTETTALQVAPKGGQKHVGRNAEECDASRIMIASMRGGKACTQQKFTSQSTTSAQLPNPKARVSDVFVERTDVWEHFEKNAEKLDSSFILVPPWESADTRYEWKCSDKETKTKTEDSGVHSGCKDAEQLDCSLLLISYKDDPKTKVSENKKRPQMANQGWIENTGEEFYSSCTWTSRPAEVCENSKIIIESAIKRDPHSQEFSCKAHKVFANLESWNHIQTYQRGVSLSNWSKGRYKRKKVRFKQDFSNFWSSAVHPMSWERPILKKDFFFGHFWTYAVHPKAWECAALNGHLAVLEHLLAMTAVAYIKQMQEEANSTQPLPSYLVDSFVCPCPIQALEFAIENGNLSVAKWIFDQVGALAVCLECQQQSLERVAQKGNLEVLLWVENQCPSALKNLSSFACDLAAGSGCVETVLWIHSKGIRPTFRAFFLAAQYGQTQMLDWLFENASECIVQYAALWKHAAFHGQLEVLQWLLQKKHCVPTNKCLELAKTNGHAHVEKWLQESIILYPKHYGPYIKRVFLVNYFFYILSSFISGNFIDHIM